MKKNISILLSATLILAMLSGCNSEETVVDTTISATSVEVVTVSNSDISNQVKLSGKIASNRDVSVYAMMSSEVLSLNVEVGDIVEKDQVLFVQDAYPVDDYTRELNNLRTSYNSTKALLDEATEQIVTALNNSRELYEIGAASKYEVEQLEFTLTQQESTNKSQLDSLTNAIDQIVSQMEDLNENTVVKSPISGVVTQVNLIENMMAASSYAAVVISDNSQMQVQISIAETLVPYIKADDIVMVTIPSMSLEPFEAVVRNVSPATNAQTGMYTVKIELPTDGEYYIGMFTEIVFTTDSVTGSLNVPSNAIVIGDEYQYVYVVGTDDLARRVPVTTGLTDGNYTQITSGLIGGEKLVVTGQEYLTDNSLVNITGGE
ncbi:MAG: efflux RND transporter periplasmic adaptor subunit [Clostridia bacterium]